jgi:putative ABC transport system permease protein
MAPYPTPVPVIDAFTASRRILDQIITRLGDAEMTGCTEQVLEEYVTTAGRDLQRQLIQDQLDTRAAAEPRLRSVAGADEIVRRRCEPGHARQVATTVGRVQTTRIAYRAPAVSNLHPADMVLALPDLLYSFPLQKAIVYEVATGSLRESADTLHRTTGQQLSTGQLMKTVTAAARDIRDFYQHQPITAGDPGDLLVLTIELHVSAIPLLAAVAAGLLTALGAGWIAGRRPARTKPGQALAEASVERLRPGGIRTVLGVAALAGGMVLTGVSARSAGSDAAGSALGVVMLFMFAVALLGPLMAWLCAGLFGRPLRGAGPAAGLAAANTRTNARRLASAITPIVLAMAFASTLVFMHTSENHAADDQLRAGLAADHVVTGPGGLPGNAAADAARLPGVETAVAALHTRILVPLGSGEFASLQGAAVQGITGTGAQLAKVQDLDVREGSLGRLGPGRIAIDTTLATAAGRGVGDRLPFYLPDGAEASPEIIAVYGRGLGLATVTMDRASLSGHVTSGFDSVLLVRGGSAESLAGLGTVTDAAGYATEQNLDAKLGAWTSNTMAAVLGGFAAIAAVNTLVMTVLARRRELSTLRLVGFTRRQVLIMLCWESLVVSAAGVILGSAIAAATLIPLIRGTTGQAPYVPPLAYGSFVAAATSLTLLAVAAPARAILRRRS